MWRKLQLENVGSIDKVVAEFIIWMIPLLPYAKMKIKVYESQSGLYTGRTDLQIKRKFDGCPEGAIGNGETVEEALENTINYFNKMLKDDGFDELTEDDIEYSEYSDF
ncbi:hypothetical protein [Limnobaculum xujianqingii]|uniref:hypothetical protein n=1 Tax=Limnobaculum xujianqingii TaxID=2738837 RepID=UPI00112BEBDA|nr:hypothetical protein [Limnobaculum xujianqingii]